MNDYECFRCGRSDGWVRKIRLEATHMVTGPDHPIKYTTTFVLCPQCETLLSEFLQ